MIRLRFRKTALPAFLWLMLVLAAPAAAKEYDPARLEGLSWVILQVKQDYLDPGRIEPPRMLKSILETIERRIPEIEIKLAEGRATIQVGGEKRTFEVGSPSTVWELNFGLQPLMAFMAAHLEPDTKPQDLEFAAIDGLLATLDPHSNLLPPELFREMSLKTTGEFGGLGIRITIRRGALTIISPLPDTPAARLGLRAWDQIVRIGDQSTVNMPLDEAVSLLRGKPGTKVTIWVMRKGWSEPHKYVITRERITVHSVESRLLEKRIGYIQIQDFGRHTDDDVARHLFKLKREAKGLQGLIIDLRNNAGGLMKAAVKVADLLLERGIIVATVAYGEDSAAGNKIQKNREEKHASADGTERQLPVVVLVNNGSASASEILAGALKNLDRALIIGQQTFGKGTVQILNDRVPEAISGSCLKLTVAEYLIPGDVSIQEVGVTPDIELVPMNIARDDLRAFVERSHFREQDIPAHVRKEHRQRLEPALTIRYLEENQQPPSDDPEQEPPLEEPGFREDFTIKLAERLLAEAPRPRATAMLDAATALLGRVAEQEQEKMIAALGKLGVDWSPAEPQGELQLPEPELQAQFKLDGAGLDASGAARADGKVLLRLEVTNRGAAPLHRLWAESQSKSALFDKREFVFGRLEPGQSRSWEVPVKIPRGALSRADETRFKFHCQCAREPEPLETLIRTRGLDRPRLELAWQLVDSGNGDDLIQPGEVVDLRVRVHNSGPGRAFKVKGLLKNDAGRDLFLKRGKGRFDLGEIAPQKSAWGEFRFEVRADSRREVLPVELAVWDAELGVNHTVKLQLPVFAQPSGAVKKVAARLRARRALLVRAGPARVLPALARVPAGSTVRADRRLPGWWRLSHQGRPLGWVEAAGVQKAAGKGGRPRIRPVAALTPPLVEVGEHPDLVPAETAELELPLTVRDRDRPLRDVTVWVGDDKVLLHPGIAAGKRLELKARLPLKPGPNLVTIVAREGLRYATQLPLVITRAGGLDWKEEPQRLADGKDASLILE